jgi:hypothetical protein
MKKNFSVASFMNKAFAVAWRKNSIVWYNSWRVNLIKQQNL